MLCVMISNGFLRFTSNWLSCQSQVISCFNSELNSYFVISIYFHTLDYSFKFSYKAVCSNEWLKGLEQFSSLFVPSNRDTIFPSPVAAEQYDPDLTDLLNILVSNTFFTDPFFLSWRLMSHLIHTSNCFSLIDKHSFL